MAFENLTLGILWNLPTTIVTILINTCLIYWLTKKLKFKDIFTKRKANFLTNYLKNKFKFTDKDIDRLTKAWYVALISLSISYLMVIIVNIFVPPWLPLFTKIGAFIINTVIFFILAFRFFKEVWKPVLKLWALIFIIDIVLGVPITYLFLLIKSLF